VSEGRGNAGPESAEYEPDREPVVIATHGESFAALRRRILRGSAWVFAGKILTILVGLAINVMLARLLTPNDLGAYFTTYALIVIGSTISELGMDRAVVRFASSAIGAGENGRARQAIEKCLRYGAVGAFVVGALLILGLGDWLALQVFHSELIAHIMPIAAGWLVMTALQELFVETFRGLQRFDLATILDELLVDLLTATLLGAMLLSRSATNLETIALLSLGATFVTAMIAGALLIGKVRGLHGPGTITRDEIFAFAWPALVTNIAILLLGRGIDLWIIGAFRGQAEVALYGSASRLVVFVATPFMIVQGVTPPIAAELHAQGRTRDMERALRGAASLAGLPAFLVLCVFIAFGPWIMGTFFKPPASSGLPSDYYAQAAPALVILSIGRLVAVWTGSCSVVLMMTGHQRTVMTVTILSGIASVLLGIFAAPRWGYIGVACTTSAVQIGQNVVQLFLAHRMVGIWTQIYLSPKQVYHFITGGGLHGVESGAER
jgi:O-antigen/teichoic acid export membrane protein